ncbi:MAG: UDP-N-acetylmuramate dehydrogenase [Parahaliea sp.]
MLRVERARSLAACNTLALESRTRAFLRADSADSIAAALDWARSEGLAVLPLGGGSNIVLAGDVDALVLQVRTRGRELLREEGDSIILRVQAGESWHALVQWCLRRGYHGLENLALIPGTVGAAPIQNIGAYGVELERFVSAVHGVFLDDGRPFTFSASQCAFGYRDSVFKHSLRDACLLTAVDLHLHRSARVELAYPTLQHHLQQQGVRAPGPREVFDAVVAIRSARLPDPAREPNAGSFFKNPVVPRELAQRLASDHPDLPVYPAGPGQAKLPAAWLIERCGWKGRRRDGVGVHPAHALVLVNYGDNSGAALLALAGEIQASVAGHFGIALDIEPRIYGGGYD